MKTRWRLRRRRKQRNPDIGYIDKYRKKIEEFLYETFKRDVGEGRG